MASAEEVRRELDRILKSRGFADAERLKNLLRYLVERKLAGEENRIKESVLAMDVFGRGPDYDTKIDSVVRVAAGKLRSRLVEYYASDGLNDGVLIDLPKGSYVPVIRSRQPQRKSWPRWAFGVVSLALLVAVLASSRRPPPNVSSLAVLPFLSLNPDKDGDFFSDGLSEELIDSLTKLEGVRVAARTSAFVFKGVNRDVREIGRRLGVEAVMEGSVRRQGSRLRVTVRLNRTSDGFHLWSNTYEGAATDLLALQEEIAQQVSGLMSVRRARDIRRVYRPEPAAYEAYLRGRQYTRQTTKQGRERAIAMYQDAIARDPKFAEAYVALADEYTPDSAKVPEARRLLKDALTIDPDLWTAHAALGRLKAEADWDWAGSDASFRRAIQLNPSSARAHRRYGRILARLGRHSESIRELRMAVRLDPLSEDDQVFLAEALFFARRFDESLKESRKTLELFPNSWLAHLNSGLAHVGNWNYPEAIRAYEQAMSLNRDNPTLGYYGALGHAYASSGDARKARELLDVLLRAQASSDVSPVHLARVYVGLGDVDKVFSYLEKGLQRRDQYMLWAKVDPRFDPVRSDPRFTALLRQMNME